MVVFQVSTGSHLADVCGEGTLVVLGDRCEVEVVGFEQSLVGVIVRRLVNGGSWEIFGSANGVHERDRWQHTVLPPTHQVSGELLAWLGVVLGEWCVLSVLVHESSKVVNIES